MNYLIFAIAFALLSEGCSDKKDVPDDLNKQKEGKNAVLEDSSSAIEPTLREPQTNGCLRGCRDLPCDEKVRCVMRNCPNIKAECEDGEYEVFK